MRNYWLWTGKQRLRKFRSKYSLELSRTGLAEQFGRSLFSYQMLQSVSALHWCCFWIALLDSEHLIFSRLNREKCPKLLLTLAETVYSWFLLNCLVYENVQVKRWLIPIIESKTFRMHCNSPRTWVMSIAIVLHIKFKNLLMNEKFTVARKSRPSRASWVISFFTKHVMS